MYEAAETDQVEDFYNFLRLLPLGEILGLILEFSGLEWVAEMGFKNF